MRANSHVLPVHLSIKIDPKLAVLFMTTAKHSRCGCLNRDGMPSRRVSTVANIDAAEPHTASASINWQTESAFGGKPETGCCSSFTAFDPLLPLAPQELRIAT
jgi:hypothetical protein